MSNRNSVIPTIHCFVIIIIDILLCSAHFLKETHFIASTKNKTKTTNTKTNTRQLRAQQPQQVASTRSPKTSKGLSVGGGQAFLLFSQVEEAFYSFLDAVGAAGREAVLAG